MAYGATRRSMEDVLGAALEAADRRAGLPDADPLFEGLVVGSWQVFGPVLDVGTLCERDLVEVGDRNGQQPQPVPREASLGVAGGRRRAGAAARGVGCSLASTPGRSAEETLRCGRAAPGEALLTAAPRHARNSGHPTPGGSPATGRATSSGARPPHSRLPECPGLRASQIRRAAGPRSDHDQCVMGHRSWWALPNGMNLCVFDNGRTSIPVPDRPSFLRPGKKQ